ncbi:NACHT domain-containing protein [Leptolyngbya sp. AS-A6]|uniref:NACHT domain-containing protein n=1 Tax=Leptolyngbya sp. AS-A6 TaxID=2933913 RepID=UPI003299615B
MNYVRLYIERHGTLKVACVRMDSVGLDKIYTAVQLLDRSALRYFESEDALQEQYRESGKRGFNVTCAEKKSGLQVANDQQYLMVLGGPGVGKSTFLRKVGLEALRTLGRRDFAAKDPGNLLVPQEIFYQHACIPVILELRQFDKPNISIKAVIAEELETCGFPYSEDLTELFLKNGKLLVLLDGLDEVPTANLDHVLREIRSLVDRYSDNRYIASCRVAAYTFGGFTRFKDVAMAAFEDEQIQQFIKNWFQKERDAETNTAERCWQLLNSPEYQAAKELAQTPLLLTLLCVVYDDYQDFPKKRHALYGEALDVLLRKWASEKRIQRNPIYQELSTELELDMLAEIAYTSFVDDQLFFSKDRLINQIREFLINNLNAPGHLDAETVLKEIEIQQGILVERARDAYSFSHLTFQEYLTAKCIVDNQKIDQLVRNHLTEQHWREVFLLVAGLAPGKRGADDLLLAIEHQVQNHYLASPKLKLLLNWATAATEGSPGQSKAVAKRTAALVLAIDHASTLDAAFGITRIYSGDIDQGRNFNQSCDLDDVNKLAVLEQIVFCQEAILLARNLDHNFTYEFRFFAAQPSFENIYHYLLERTICLVNEFKKAGVFKCELIDPLIIDLDALHQRILSNELPEIEQFQIMGEGFLSFARNLGFEEYHVVKTRQEVELFSNFFHTLEFMIRCKEAAVRVSPQVWAGIESRMVTVPTE